MLSLILLAVSIQPPGPIAPLPPVAPIETAEERRAELKQVDDRLAVVAQRLDAAIAGTVTEDRRATKLIVYPRSARLNPPRGGDLIVLLTAAGAEDEPVELPETAKLSIDGRPARDTYLASWFRMADDPRVELDRSTDRYGIVTAARFRDAAPARPVARPASRVVRYAAPPAYVAPRPPQVARRAYYYAAGACVGGSCAVPQRGGFRLFGR